MDDELRKQVDELHEFNRKGTPGHIRWACFVDGKIKKMASRPCYGEMRSYGQKSTRPQDDKPDDLPQPMPIGGKRGALGLCFMDHQVSDSFIRQVFDPETSPWRRGIAKDVEFSIKNDKIVGVVYPTPDVDPTVMLNLFINSRGFGVNDKANDVIRRTFPELSDPEVFFLSFFFRHRADNWQTPDVISGCQTYHASSYSLNGSVNLNRWFSGESVDISNGRTWLDGEDYNRTALADVFVDKDAEPVIKSLTSCLTIVGNKTTADDYKKAVNAFHERYQKEFAK